MSATYDHRDRFRRRGAIAVFMAVSGVVLLGFAALAVDAGRLYLAKTELQVAADAAALAGANELLNERRLFGAGDLLTSFQVARQQAGAVAARNPVLGCGPQIDYNPGNKADGDLVIGYLSTLYNTGEAISFSDVTEFNAVKVRLRRDATHNGPVALMFARILGIDTADIVAEATAAFQDGIVGFRVRSETGTAGLLPLTLHESFWDLLMGTLAGDNSVYQDNYAYDPQTGEVTWGQDGLPEINLYPGVEEEQLPSGNFGTVDIGGDNNATSDIERQLLDGISAEDFEHHGGELSLADGPFTLTGDTGLSAGLKDALEAITGEARTIPLFSDVSGPGDNAAFTIVKFAGIRIMDAKLTGAMKFKCVVIQPAIAMDDAAIVGGGGRTSENVYHPAILVR
jgi:Flp pilus assembly protein TadG